MGFDWFELFVLALATWRVANIITAEDGPFKVFARVRAWRDFGGLLTCIYCMSVWVALALLLIHLLLTPYVSYVFAISGLALMLRSYTGVQHG